MPDNNKKTLPAPSSFKKLNTESVPKSQRSEVDKMLDVAPQQKKVWKDIPANANPEGINKFQREMQAKGYHNLKDINTTEGYNKYILPELNRFNKENPSLAITPEHIDLLQKYHQSVDPTIVNDKRYGTQTANLMYPEPTVATVSPAKTQYQGSQIQNFGNSLYDVKTLPDWESGAGYGKPRQVYVERGTQKIIDPSKTTSSGTLGYTGETWQDLLNKGQAKSTTASNVINTATTGNVNTADIVKENPLQTYSSTLPAGQGGGGVLEKNVGQSKVLPIQQSTIKPSLINYKAGGLVKHIKGYDGGGPVEDDTNSKNSSNAAGGLQLASSLGNNVFNVTDNLVKDPYGRYNTGNKAANYLVGGVYEGDKGALKGAAEGAQFGPEGMIAGAIGGGFIGMGKGLYEASQGNKSIDQEAAAKLKAQQEAYKRLENIKLQNNLAQQKLNQVNTYKDGGKIEGKGTAKSDSIKAKVKEDSFIVPAERNKIAEVIRKVVLKAPDSKKKANLNQKGGEEVRLSNGEHLFTPKEVEKIENTLGDTFLDKLAPNSAKKEDIKEGEFDEMEKAHMANGGLLSAHKAKIMLHEGTANGQPISDKQRRFFGWVAGGRKAEGGVIDAYADGGDIDPKSERAKLEAAKKAREQDKLINEAKTAKNKQYYAVKNIVQKNLEKQLQDKKDAEAQIKKHQAEYKALQDAYKLHDEQTSKSLNRKQGAIEKGVGASGIPNAEDVAKQKEELLSKIEAKKAMLDKANKDLEYASNEKNYIGGNKSTIPNIKNSDFTKAQKLPNIYSGTGAQIESSMSPQDKAKSLSSTAVPKGSSLKAPSNVSKIGFKPNLATDNPDIVPPVAEKSKEQIDAEKQAANPAQKMAQTAQVSEPSGNKSGKYAGLINQGLSQLTGLGNYILPAKQTQMGLKYLAASGQRPVDIVDPGFQATVDRANANAKFGFTPEEQAALNMQNVDLLNAQKAAARNYSGGSAGNAYNMERDAANQSFARGLENTIGSRNLQMQKQGYADQMNLAKADKMRQLFEDRMGAWQQQQAAGAGLVGAGIRNLIGANRYSAELNSMNQANNFGNSWINNV